tara:strand:- start:3 stop:410 length:408 start_codon:yes stop_codon:yes gene_type:complete
MDLTTNQIIAMVVSLIVILKMAIMFLLPNSSFKKFISIYDNININTLYYINITIGSLVFYCIYSSSDFSLSDMLAIGFAMLLIVNGAMIKIFGGKELSKSFEKYETFNDIFKALWLYILLWIILAIMTLKEIFFS